MGGMHAWLWGCTYPDTMDALLPLASLPAEIAGRNRMWRTMIVDAIRSDHAWRDGDYTAQPHGLRTAAQILFLRRSNPRARHQEFPTGAAAERALLADAERFVQAADANDVLHAVEASRDYDPDLEAIRAPLLAINFADDLVNPPDLGILESRIRLVRRGRAITIPQSDATRGHGTHTLAAVWKEHLVALLQETGPR
jgi:homoserine O-acetyltransferase